MRNQKKKIFFIPMLLFLRTLIKAITLFKAVPSKIIKEIEIVLMKETIKLLTG